MRLRLINRSLLSSPISCCRRNFHHAFLRAKTTDPAIFENSLEKTLEEHRSANRQSLIRKVLVGPAPPTPEPSTVPSERLVEEPPKLKSTHQTSTRKRITATQKTPARHSGDRKSPAYRNIQWKTRGKPEQCPWLDHIGPKTCSGGISQLDGEIRALDKYMTPTTEESEVMRQIVSEVTEIMNKSVRGPLQITGSRRTGFQLSHSNLNLMLQVTDPARSPSSIRQPSAARLKNLRHYRKLLLTVTHALKQHPDYAVQIDQGSKPCSEAIHRPTGVHLHLNCGEELPAYVEYTQDFLAEYPSLRPLYITTRLILETQGLFGPARSSIDSVTLQILLAAFLKLNHGRFQRISASGSYAEPLLTFLRTFGSEVDLKTTGVAVDPPGFFDADSVKAATSTPAVAHAEHDSEDNILPAYIRGQRALITAKRNAAIQGNKALAARLCVQDPANYLRDLGGSCTRTVEVQTAFANAYARLKAALDAWVPSSPDDGNEHLRPSILSYVVRANFEDFEARRAKIVSRGTN
ncbi:hypothetical protein BJY01DRAFT_251850 [Aspergillus pseudoustus]|uniref:Uncharacterized protein n=1 Tax=Aspergillus pseudoustus TaxID=1810923 RepID=A0ABR4J9D3_9EURO